MNSKRNFKNVIFSFLGTVLPMVLALFTTPFLIRTLGEEAYGLQNIAVLLCVYFAFLDMGLDIPIVKFLAEYNALNKIDSANKLLSTTLLLFIIIGIVGAVGIYLLSVKFVGFFKVSNILKEDAVFIFRLAAVSFLFTPLSSWSIACLSGMQRLDIVNIIRMLNLFLTLCGGVAVVAAGYGVKGFVFVRTFFAVCVSFVYFFYTYRTISFYKLSLKIDKESFQRLKSYMISGFTLRVSAFCINGLDRTLLGTMLGLPFVAAYSVQMTLLSPISSLIDSLYSFCNPLISELNAKKENLKLKGMFIFLAKTNSYISCWIYGGLYLFGKPFFLLWVGPDVWEKISKLYPIYVISICLSQIFVGVTHSFVIGIGKIRLFTFYSLLKSIITSTMISIGIYLFGIVGIGFAAMISVVVLNFPYFLYITRKYLSFGALEYVSICFFPIIVVLVAGFFTDFFFKTDKSLSGIVQGSLIYSFVYCLISYYSFIRKNLKNLYIYKNKPIKNGSN